MRRGQRVTLTRKLNTFDVTSLVVGSIVGADIYVAAAFGARLVGAASLIVWLVSGIMAIVIALCFSRCARAMPVVGGPYAYSKEAFGQFPGFMVGWSMLLAEWLSLAVFPVAFVQYTMALFPGLDPVYDPLVKGAFIAVIFSTNLIGVRAAGKVNDVLTIAKLAPLFLIVVGGVAFLAFDPKLAADNFTPFVRGSAGDFASALVLIFWAYAGFELSTLPASEIERPERTIPRAIVTGMMIVTVFYLATNFVILGAVDQESLVNTQSPLIDTADVVFAGLGSLAGIVPAIVGFGALLSILGADESGTIGTSRLAYALSLDGLLPHALSRRNKRFNTPHFSLAVICVTAFAASLVGGLGGLITASVFLLAIAYLATCAASIKVRTGALTSSSRSSAGIVLPLMGIFFSALLLVLVDMGTVAVSLAMLAVGIPIYAAFSPKKELTELKAAFTSREAVLRRTYEQGERFLAYPWRRIAWLYYRLSGRPRPWVVEPHERRPQDGQG